MKSLTQTLGKISVGKALTGIVAAGLIGLTSLKENVHFGLIAPVELQNPTGTHYIWGPISIAVIKGNGEPVEANIRNYGLLAGINHFEEGITLRGNSTAAGLFLGLNDYTKSQKIEGDSTVVGLAGAVNNYTAAGTVSGNSSAIALVLGLNDYKSTSYQAGLKRREGNTTSVAIGTVNENGFGIGPRNIKRYGTKVRTMQ